MMLEQKMEIISISRDAVPTQTLAELTNGVLLHFNQIVSKLSLIGRFMGRNK